VKRLLNSERAISQFLAEARVFEEVRKLAKPEGALLRPIFTPTAAFYSKYPFFILPLAMCDLKHLLQDAANTKITTSLLTQLPLLAEALGTLHNLGIAHRDLDARNVLVFEDDSGAITLKLADFGHSIWLNTESRGFGESIGLGYFRSNGTYSAPECAKPPTVTYGPRDITAIDIWALGCMFLEILAFARGGSAGVRQFQALRHGPLSAGGITVESDLFHDGDSLKPQIGVWLGEVFGASVFKQNTSEMSSNVHHILLEMFDRNAELRPTAQEISTALKETDLLTIFENDIAQLSSPTFASHMISRLFSWAAKHVSKEPALAPQSERIRWKCVSVCCQSSSVIVIS